MTSIDPNHRSQIEMYLERPLTEAELQIVDSLESLEYDQRVVLATIRPRSCIAPILYLRAIVPRADLGKVRELVNTHETSESWMPRPYQPDRNAAGLSAGRQAEIETIIERPLTDNDLRRVSSLDELAPEQLAVFERLAMLPKERRALCLMYLHHAVPLASIPEKVSFMGEVLRRNT
jgi:hypothetical protein